GVAGDEPAAPSLLERAGVRGGETVGVGDLVWKRKHALLCQARNTPRFPREMARQALLVTDEAGLGGPPLLDAVKEHALARVLHGHLEIAAADIADGHRVVEVDGARVEHV